jgi:hypothetical protein
LEQIHPDGQWQGIRSLVAFVMIATVITVACMASSAILIGPDANHVNSKMHPANIPKG